MALSAKAAQVSFDNKNESGSQNNANAFFKI